MTQEGLAFQAGLSRPYISELERDLKSPTLDTLFLLCDALGVSAASIVERVEKGRKQKPRR
jgi:transcriptional regulator with XRE-family HTH domain